MRVVFSLLLRVVPPGRGALVYGAPDSEGNAVEVVRWLARDGRRQVTWLTNSGDTCSLDWALDGVPLGRVRSVPRSSMRGLVAYVRAREVFTTHPVYVSPPRRGRLFVQLWHGDGPKVETPVRIRTDDCSFVVAGTQVWGAQKARALGTSPDRLLLVGNPRIDQYERAASDNALARLGIEPDRPFVVWAPTFRRAEYQGWKRRDGEMLSTRQAALGPPLAAWAAQHRLQVVVRPHPMDGDEFGSYGLVVLDDAVMQRAGVPLYSVLARSAALVTDYSSIWTDYLPLGRPVGHFCPDLESYAEGRGLDREAFERLLAGPLLHTPDDLIGFLHDVEQGRDVGADRRHKVARDLGAVLCTGATERLFDALRARGAW